MDGAMPIGRRVLSCGTYELCSFVTVRTFPPVDTKQDIALFNESVYTLATAGVAQLVRALPCHGRGRGFESLRSRRKV